MPVVCSATSAPTLSGSPWSGYARCSSLKSTHSVAPILKPDSQEYQSTMMYERSKEPAEAPKCSSVGLPVSVPASPQPSTGSATASPCGLGCDVSPTSWRRNGLSWSSPPATRSGKPKCVTIWAQMASTQPDLSLRLATLVRLIFDGECSFLPTPVSRDWRSPGLRSHARLQKSRGQPLPEIIGSRVHPELCEWLMGLPNGWTVTLPSRPSATATRRKCSPSSGGRSGVSHERN